MWQRIETAPKDGLTRLLFWDDVEHEAFLGIRPLDCPDDACCCLHGIAAYPSHWMPIPPAPGEDQ